MNSCCLYGSLVAFCLYTHWMLYGILIISKLHLKITLSDHCMLEVNPAVRPGASKFNFSRDLPT